MSLYSKEEDVRYQTPEELSLVAPLFSLELAEKLPSLEDIKSALQAEIEKNPEERGELDKIFLIAQEAYIQFILSENPREFAMTLNKNLIFRSICCIAQVIILDTTGVPKSRNLYFTFKKLLEAYLAVNPENALDFSRIFDTEKIEKFIHFLVKEGEKLQSIKLKDQSSLSSSEAFQVLCIASADILNKSLKQDLQESFMGQTEVSIELAEEKFITPQAEDGIPKREEPTEILSLSPELRGDKEVEEEIEDPEKLKVFTSPEELVSYLLNSTKLRDLSARQKEFLAWRCTGMKNREIALKFGVKEGTVNFSLSTAYGRLGLSPGRTKNFDIAEFLQYLGIPLKNVHFISKLKTVSSKMGYKKRLPLKRIPSSFRKPKAPTPSRSFLNSQTFTPPEISRTVFPPSLSTEPLPTLEQVSRPVPPEMTENQKTLLQSKYLYVLKDISIPDTHTVENMLAQVVRFLKGKNILFFNENDIPSNLGLLQDIRLIETERTLHIIYNAASQLAIELPFGYKIWQTKEHDVYIVDTTNKTVLKISGVEGNIFKKV